MQVARAPKQKAHTVRKASKKAIEKVKATGPGTFMMREKGNTTKTARGMLRDLVALHNVPVAHAEGVVSVVTAAVGVTVEGRANSTTHKNVNYKSRHIMLTTSSGEKVSCAIGVYSAINHTSETQLKGWWELVLEMYRTYNESSRGKEYQADPREFYLAVKGISTDRARDQKKFVHLLLDVQSQANQETRGEKALSNLAHKKYRALLNKLAKHPCLMQEVHLSVALCTVHIKIGQKEFDGLLDIEKDAATFFVWAGCFMHKGLNTVKGGYTRMSGCWKKHDLLGPAKLLNKDNAAAASIWPSAARLRGIEVSKRGAIKVLSLVGAIFCHKDNKKGQQDTLCFYMEAKLGYTFQWPDTSNTQYQSYGDAATVWIIHHELLISFLGVVKDKKEKYTFRNIKKNVLTRLLDPEMDFRIYPLAIYSQIITIPCMQQVRGPTQEHTNILDLEPFLIIMIAHCTAIVADPDLAPAPDARYQTATLNGQPFKRLEVFYAVQRLILMLPKI
ncbi:hypothetical protein SERLADRAFT_404512 [Serpula lacrymans var. lacrymans S7.9]|uniref:Uncharacterized protein n=1 Tax=Serpula lacrymans var. lacrymans (strain S7.9) TaxID=578457 RepID=F8NDC1_SERL9|nr:uncharacterized protein SERLADRAFT_404512 [Serpula lacrymans var. lacrymans S7.9]EGO30259.1 hypothetical protein SERLADRAFT_404512 [Serpula lacrymans var. lacrymans S7.9]